MCQIYSDEPYPGYSFSNVTTEAWPDATLGLVTNADTYLFWDGMHPTEKAQKLLGDAAYNLVASSPSVNSFAVSPATLTEGNSIQVQWTVSDSNGPGLKQVELWRAPDAGGVPGSWGSAPIQTPLSVSGNGQVSGSFVDSPASGKWWYGIHVVDMNGAYSTEQDAGLGPKSVTVTAPVGTPSLPVHVSPLNNGTVNGPSVTFNWDQSANATGYELYVRDLTTQALSTYAISGGATTQTTLTLIQGRSYRWNMQAFNGTTGSGVTTAWEFAVNATANNSPLVGVVTPSGTLSGNITINYSLFDDESDSCSIQVQYSPNGGTTWYSATQGSGGNGTSGLASLPLGSPHTYAWNSTTDIGSTNNSNVKIRITASDAGGAGSPATTGTFTVLNQPVSPPELTISDASVTEGNSGTTDCTFSVVLSHAASQNVTVQWVTGDGTATVGDSDYQSASNTLTIPAGQLSGTITVKVVGDTKYEDNEYFVVNLSNPSGATLLRSQGAGTILNDDQSPGSPEIVVEGWNGTIAHEIPIGKPNPEWIDGTYFGSADQNSTPPAQTYTVRNTGTAPLTVATPTLPSGFTIIEPLNGSIGPGGSDDFTVQMSTANGGTFSGNISFTNNDGGEELESPFSFAILGTVVYAGLATTTTVLTVSPSSVIYGEPVTFTANVSLLPSGSATPSGGTVTFIDGGTVLGTASVSAGTASMTTTLLPAGSQLVMAIYSGNGSDFPGSSSSMISTIAGNGVAGYGGDGGQATAAQLSNPFGVAVDTDGNMFIADQSNNRIRRVNLSTGIVTTIVGNGTQGYNGDNIQATSASLNGPLGVAVDALGCLFIADTGNNRIRVVDLSTGVISTVAGNGIYGYGGDGGQATDAMLRYPTGIAVDASGNLFIADSSNNRIRNVNLSTGVINTFAGNGVYGYGGDGGQATAASLCAPIGITVDASGNVFVADWNNNRIREVTASTQVITTVAGNGTAVFNGDNIQAAVASVSPKGVAVDNKGNLFIADSGHSRVRKVNLLTGLITTIAGSGQWGYGGDGGSPLAAEFHGLDGIAVTTGGDLFVADRQNSRIRRVTPAVSVQVAPAQLTVMADNKSRVYGAGNPPFTATISGFHNGETLATSGVSGNPSLTTSAIAVSPVGSYPITASLGTLAANNYTFTFINGALDVTPVPLTASVTIGSKVYDGTPTATITGRSLSGVIGSDDVVLTDGTATFVDKNAGNGKTAMATGLSLTGADAANYTANATATTNASIIPASLTASVAIDSKLYDGTPTATITSRSLSGVIRFDDVSLMGGTATFVDKNAGAGKAVTAIDLILVGVDAGNYTANATATADATITPALLTVTADDKSRAYGVPNPTFTASYAGFKNGETLTISGVTGSPTLDCTATPTSPVGNYTIVAGLGTLAAQNYNFSFVNGTLVVIADTTPPTVTNVLVRGTGWASTFPFYNGYSIPVGSGSQLVTLPWTNIDQIKVVFSEDVAVDQGDLNLGGVSLTDYAFLPDLPNGSPNDGFVYDPATFTATWTLTAPLNTDKLVMRLNADGTNPIQDGAGNRLDGEWTNPVGTSDTGTDTYPSGNGVAGGNFSFRFNVLPGDATQDGTVGSADLGRLLVNFGQSGTTWHQGDFTGDGIVGPADLGRILVSYGAALPSGEPLALFLAGALSVAASVPTADSSAPVLPVMPVTVVAASAVSSGSRRVEPSATSKDAESAWYVQHDSEPAALPLATAKPVTPAAAVVAVEVPKSQPKAGLSPINIATAVTVRQLTTRMAVEPWCYVQQGLGKTVSDPVGWSWSFTTVAPSTPSISSVAAIRLPKPQPKIRPKASDSAVLWMVAELDASKDVESSVGSLVHTRRSDLIPEVGISVFDEEDDWAAGLKMMSHRYDDATDSNDGKR